MKRYIVFASDTHLEALTFAITHPDPARWKVYKARSGKHAGKWLAVRDARPLGHLFCRKGRTHFEEMP